MVVVPDVARHHRIGAQQAVAGAADGLMPATWNLPVSTLVRPKRYERRSAKSRPRYPWFPSAGELVEKRVREVQALLVEQYKRGTPIPTIGFARPEVTAHFAAGHPAFLSRHTTLDALDLRSLAARLNRCSAPCGVMPPTASPICRQLAPRARRFGRLVTETVGGAPQDVGEAQGRQ